MTAAVTHMRKTNPGSDVPPPSKLFDVETERVVVASILDGQFVAAVAAGLKLALLSTNTHRWIFRACVALLAAGSPIEIASVGSWIRDQGHHVDSNELYDFLIAPTAVGANLRFHIESLANRTLARTLAEHWTKQAAAIQADPASASVLLAESQTALTDFGAAVTSKAPFEPNTPAYLLEEDAPVNYLIEELSLCPGPPAMIAGYGYSGKTASAQAIALAVASGTRAFGWFHCRQGKTLHIDYEQGSGLTKRRYKRLALGAGLELAALANDLGFISYPPMYMHQPEAEGELLRQCAGVALCVIDSLAASAPGLDENSAEIRQFLDMLARVSEKTACVFLVIHHARKPSEKDPPGTRYAIRGSSAIFDGCGNVIVIDGKKDDAKLVVHHKERQRGKTHDDFYITVEDVPVGDDPVAGLRVRALTVDDATPKQALSDEWRELLDVIFEHVQKNPGIAGKGAIASQLKMGRTRVFDAVAELIQKGRIENRGTTQRPAIFVKADSQSTPSEAS